MLTARGTITIRPKEVIPVFREEWNASVADYKYDLQNRDFVSRSGNIYNVKTQRPGKFVPAGVDPASSAGMEYWEMFNNLKPSVTNFLVIVDEEGTPQTLMSGGRIQAKFLNIGSLNMSETRLWGGAEPMTGKGLALINDPGDRKFVVYNDTSNYVEMFQRQGEWGLKGVVGGNVLLQLGTSNKIGPFEIGKDYLSFINKQISQDIQVSMVLGGEQGFDLNVGWLEQIWDRLGEKTALKVKLSTSRSGQAILAESSGYKDNSNNYALRTIGKTNLGGDLECSGRLSLDSPSVAASGTLSFSDLKNFYYFKGSTTMVLPNTNWDGKTRIVWVSGGSTGGYVGYNRDEYKELRLLADEGAMFVYGDTGWNVYSGKK